MSYVIFKTGGQQFRAEPGVTIRVPLLDAKPGDEVSFDNILVASDGKSVQTGAPKLSGAKVTAEVVRHGKDKKVRIFRFARRNGYRRHGGHRQDFTEIKIADVKVG
jgi:large subunit ribosomal protein L21